jgi:hypothetical protein
MRKWAIGAVLALGAAVGVFAQDTAPIDPVATLEAGNFRALGVTSDGERLFVGDAENNQTRVYSFGDPSNPQLLNTVDLDGSPVALVGVQDFALVAVTERSADLLQVVAIPSYNPRQGYINYGTYDITRQPRGIAISPSDRWAAVYGANGFTLLEVLSSDEINSVTLEGDAVQSAALTNNALLLLHTDSATVEIVTLERGAQLGEIRQMRLAAPGRAIAVNARGTLGAVLLENNTVVLFDLSNLTQLSSVALRGQFTEMQFVTGEDSESLVLAQLDQSGFALLDVTQPDSVGQLSTSQLSSPLQALTVYNNLIIASDGQTVSIYEV